MAIPRLQKSRRTKSREVAHSFNARVRLSHYFRMDYGPASLDAKAATVLVMPIENQLYCAASANRRCPFSATRAKASQPVKMAAIGAVLVTPKLSGITDAARPRNA